MAIFLDLDETLVFTTHHGWSYDDYDSVLRPGCRAFLESLSKFNVPIYVITHGLTDFQIKICKEHNIYHMFDDLWGRDQYHKVPKTPNAILVDDRDMYSPYTQLKLQTINLGKQSPWGLWETDRLIRVQSFKGQPDDCELMVNVLPAITKLLV